MHLVQIGKKRTQKWTTPQSTGERKNKQINKKLKKNPVKIYKAALKHLPNNFEKTSNHGLHAFQLGFSP